MNIVILYYLQNNVVFPADRKELTTNCIYIYILFIMNKYLLSNLLLALTIYISKFFYLQLLTGEAISFPGQLCSNFPIVSYVLLILAYYLAFLCGFLNQLKHVPLHLCLACSKHFNNFI